MKENTTHFGFETVAEEQKQKKVAEVFSSVAQKYDVMNDLMSFGLHRIWKAFTIQISGVRSGDRVLDVAGGTADLSLAFARKVGERGQVPAQECVVGPGEGARRADRGAILQGQCGGTGLRQQRAGDPGIQSRRWWLFGHEAAPLDPLGQRPRREEREGAVAVGVVVVAGVEGGAGGVEVEAGP